MRIDRSAVRAGALHVARLQASARTLGLPVPDEQAFLQAVATAPGEGEVVRVTLHDEDGRPALAAARRAATAADRVDAISLVGWYATGYRLREHKLTSHFHGVRGRALAHSRGAADALLVEEMTGLVGEATNANVIALIEGVAVTPPIDGVLPGVTRALCIRLLPTLGVAIDERPLSLTELSHRTSLLLSSSLRGVVPVASVDGAPLAEPDPALLAALVDALDWAEGAAALPLPLP